MSIIKLLFALLVNNFRNLYTLKATKEWWFILQFDNRHLQINMSSSVGAVVKSTYIIFCTHNFWQASIPMHDLCDGLI